MADGPILVTGAAGFIGFHVAQRLLREGRDVVGLDNMNSYYDPALKDARRAELAKSSRLRFVKLDLANRDGMASLFKEHRFPYVVHLAAQAGVRHVDPRLDRQHAAATVGFDDGGGERRELHVGDAAALLLLVRLSERRPRREERDEGERGEDATTVEHADSP